MKVVDISLEMVLFRCVAACILPASSILCGHIVNIWAPVFKPHSTKWASSCLRAFLIYIALHLHCFDHTMRYRYNDGEKYAFVTRGLCLLLVFYRENVSHIDVISKAFKD